jgi:hypothetical protein
VRTREDVVASIKEKRRLGTYRKIETADAPKKRPVRTSMRQVQQQQDMKQEAVFEILRDASPKHKAAFNKFMQQDPINASAGMAKLMKTTDMVNTSEYISLTKKSFGSWKKELKPNEISALHEYKRDSTEINDLLRKTRSNKVHPTIAAIDAAVSKGKTDSDLVLYRGLGADKKLLAGLLGKGITDPAFMSTTVFPKVTTDFMPDPAYGESVGEASVVLVINLPKGSPCIPLVDAGTKDDIILDYNQSQGEFLLPRNTTVIPTKIEKQDAGTHPPEYIVHAEVVFNKVK